MLRPYGLQTAGLGIPGPSVPQDPFHFYGALVRLSVADPLWETFLESSDDFWRRLTPVPTDGGVILVEAFSEYFRVVLRNMSVANALRLEAPSRLVVVSGIDRGWTDGVWPDVDLNRLRELVSAFGGQLFDIHAAAHRLRASPTGRIVLRLADRDVHVDANRALDEVEMLAVLRATWSRQERRPPFPLDATSLEAERHEYRFSKWERQLRCLAQVWTAVVEQLELTAMVTSHVDYDQWALGVVPAMNQRVPVIHVHSTGGLKAHAIYPEATTQHFETFRDSYRERPARMVGSHADLRPTYRSILSPLIAEHFDGVVQGLTREQAARVDTVIERNAANLGRPSWWRGGPNATLDMHGPSERAVVRPIAAHHLGLDADRPVIGLFNHAISDALNTNREAFDSLTDWFEETIGFAAEHKDVGWLVLDHPSQDLYDASDFFEGIATKYADHENLVFRRSNELTKNSIWSLVDLAVTVRGSIGHEMPAYGIGSLQAGWSEWSHCGIGHVADTPDAYWTALGIRIDDLRGGRGSATWDQMRRARIWQWYYRSVTDVPTCFVPHWDHHNDEYLVDHVARNYRHVEPDGEPLFEAVAEMWRHRAPVLQRPQLGITGSDDSGSGLLRRWARPRRN